MCSAALHSPLPPFALYTWVTRHLTASGSLNVTCLFWPLHFLIPSLSLKQVIPHHPSHLPPPPPFSFVSPTVCSVFKTPLHFFSCPEPTNVSPHPPHATPRTPQAPWGALTQQSVSPGVLQHLSPCTRNFCILSISSASTVVPTGVGFVPQGHLAMSGDIFIVTTWWGVGGVKEEDGANGIY